MRPRTSRLSVAKMGLPHIFRQPRSRPASFIILNERMQSVSTKSLPQTTCSRAIDSSFALSTDAQSHSFPQDLRLSEVNRTVGVPAGEPHQVAPVQHVEPELLGFLPGIAVPDAFFARIAAQPGPTEFASSVGQSEFLPLSPLTRRDMVAAGSPDSARNSCAAWAVSAGPAGKLVVIWQFPGEA